MILESVEESSGLALNKKTILALVGIGVLLAATTLTVYLVQQRQVFKPKASENKPVSTPETSLTLASAGDTFKVGDQIRVSVFVRSDIDAANLFAAKLRFPADLLEVASINISANNSTNICDVNKNGKIDLEDGKIVSSCWNKPATGVCAEFDTNGNKRIDISEVQRYTGMCPQIFATATTAAIINPQEGGTGGYFIKNWVENYFDNKTGSISLVGGVPTPGFKTVVGQISGVIAEVNFVAKATGLANVSFDSGSAIYRNVDNVNILGVKRELSLNLQPTPVEPPLTPTISCTPRPACLDFQPACKIAEPTEGWCPTASLTPTMPAPVLKGDVNGNNTIDLIDLSALLSAWGKAGNQVGYADLNSDGVVNAFDYSALIKILVENKVIKV